MMICHLLRLRRMKQAQEARKARESLMEKVAARSFTNNYLSIIHKDVSGRGRD